MTRRKVLQSTGAWGLAALPAAGVAALQRAPERGGLCLNEDNSHFFATRAGQNLGPADVDAWVDQYAGTQIRELMLQLYAYELREPGLGSNLAGVRSFGPGRSAAARQRICIGEKKCARVDSHGVETASGRHRCLCPLDCALPASWNFAVDFGAHRTTCAASTMSVTHTQRLSGGTIPNSGG